MDCSRKRYLLHSHKALESECRRLWNPIQPQCARRSLRLVPAADPAVATDGCGGASAHRRPHKDILRPDGTQKKQEYRGYSSMEDSFLEN